MSDEMVLVPKSLLSCATADGLDVQDVLDNLTGADWHSGSYVPQTAAEHRNQVIRELIEKALGSEADNYKAYDGYVAEWLKSQMEGD
jgi:hypothetical protein